MREINSDYVGLLKIDGTTINYPVVRGNDNVKYLNTTFGGDKNIVGAIFMDYRCVGDNVPHFIIYGHEVDDLDGTKLMFGGLCSFLDEQYLAEHSEIMLMENNKLSVFEIFSARVTDINDSAYYLDLNAQGSFQSFAERNGAPPDAEQIITLSTCVGADNDRRMIVQGVLK
jgi:sortase B